VRCRRTQYLLCSNRSSGGKKKQKRCCLLAAIFKDRWQQPAITKKRTDKVGKTRRRKRRSYWVEASGCAKTQMDERASERGEGREQSVSVQVLWSFFIWSCASASASSSSYYSSVLFWNLNARNWRGFVRVLTKGHRTKRVPLDTNSSAPSPPLAYVRVWPHSSIPSN
jgi:hypothetical protein